MNAVSSEATPGPPSAPPNPPNPSYSVPRVVGDLGGLIRRAGVSRVVLLFLSGCRGASPFTNGEGRGTRRC